MKHAELPWIAFEDGQIQSINSKVVIWSSGLAKRSKNANAAFIVKACNEREGLLELNRTLLTALEWCMCTIEEEVENHEEKTGYILGAGAIKAAQE